MPYEASCLRCINQCICASAWPIWHEVRITEPMGRGCVGGRTKPLGQTQTLSKLLFRVRPAGIFSLRLAQPFTFAVSPVAKDNSRSELKVRLRAAPDQPVLVNRESLAEFFD